MNTHDLLLILPFSLIILIILVAVFKKMYLQIMSTIFPPENTVGNTIDPVSNANNDIDVLKEKVQVITETINEILDVMKEFDKEVDSINLIASTSVDKIQDLKKELDSVGEKIELITGL